MNDRCLTTMSRLSVAAIALVAGMNARAQEWPARGKTMTLIVGFAAGGSSDVGARILAGGLEKVLGTKVEVQNKPGASGQLGYTAIARAKPDGYTFGVATLPGIMVSCLDPDRKAAYTKDSFQPVALQVVDAGILAVRTDSPYKTLKDVIDDARARPKKVTITTTGIQTGDHFEILELQKAAGVQFAIVHFDGGSTAMTALLGKKVDAYVGNIGDIRSQLSAGEIRVLGVMDKEESPFVPGAKTFTAQGVPVVGGSLRGYLLPAGTPRPIVQKLSAAIKTALESPEVKSGLDKLGLRVRYLGVEDYTAMWNDYASSVKDLIPLSKQ